MKIETREKFPNFVGFVSGVDLKKELNDELVEKIDEAINKLSVLVFKNQNINEPNLLEFLDLVSLATVCDVVPLVGLNRALVTQGLKVLSTKKNLGLKTLIDICKIENHPNIYHLDFPYPWITDNPVQFFLLFVFGSYRF